MVPTYAPVMGGWLLGSPEGDDLHRSSVALAAFGGHPGFDQLAKPATWQRRPGIR